MNFIENTLSSLLGFFLAIFLLFVVLLGVGGVVASNDKVELDENSVLNSFKY